MYLFVYGSLKRGECNFHEVERWVVAVTEAWCPGRLYLRPDGYPALVLDGGGGVPGELLELTQPEAALAHLDEFEGYYPGHDSEYQRVTVACTAVRRPLTAIPAQTYVCAPHPSWPRIERWPVTPETPAPYTTGRLKRPKN